MLVADPFELVPAKSILAERRRTLVEQFEECLVDSTICIAQLLVPIEQEPWLNIRSGSRAVWKLPGRKPTRS
jgi:hypothetical protein